MKRKEVKFRLSPNEEAQLIREERERRRKLRLQQVREQQRYIAQRVREKVEQRRQHELELLEEDLRAEWEQQQTERVNNLQRLYQESLSLVGQGHRSAKENKPDPRVLSKKEDNDAKAEERFRKALKELKLKQLKNHENQSRSIDARKKALQVEKLRSAKVSSLPLPPSQSHQDTGSKQQHVVKKCDSSTFAATHYHMPETMVDKERNISQPNARVEAELEVERLQVLQREEEQKKEEQQEKAQLRGRQALRREQLLQDHGRLLVELEHMQQTDLWRRRQKVSDMPRQIFEPLYKRKEADEDLQRDMEFAFEDMYTGERRVKGDLMFQLVPEPLPSPSTSSHDQDLDVTQDDLTVQSEIYDSEHEGKRQKAKSTNPEVVDGRPAPRLGLKKLLDRIQTQRQQWSQHDVRASSSKSSESPPDQAAPIRTELVPEETVASASIRTHPVPEQAAPSSSDRTDPPSISTDSSPERQSSLDTGSLRSGEPFASAQADMELSNALAKRIKEFEEQQKIKEEELEQERQAQIDYLQRLEEQRLKLKQRLFEAQQARHLKTSARPTAATDPPVQNYSRPLHFVGDHTRRMEEHRLQLLHQNETHQKSVAVARQRLEEYQRALRIRYNLPAKLPQSVTDSVCSSAVQVLPSRPVETVEEVQVSVEASARDLDQTLASQSPCSDMGFDSKTPLAQLQNGSDFPTFQLEKLLLQLTQNRMRSHLQTDVPSTNRSVRSSLDYCPPSSMGLESSPKISSAVHPGLALSVGVDPSPPISPAVSLGVHPSLAVPPGVHSIPVVPSGVHPSSAVSLGVHPSPATSLDIDPSPVVFLDVDCSSSILQSIEEGLERSRVWNIQGQAENVRLRPQLEVEGVRLDQQQRRREELVRREQQNPTRTALDTQASQDRSNLLKSLLKAMEKSKGGTLRPENSQHKSSTSGFIQHRSLFSGHPPVSRAGLRNMETAPHQLSMIEEVQTPVSLSLLTGEELVTVENPLQKGEQSVATPRAVHTDSGASPGSSLSDLARNKFSPLSPDSGRGADYSNPGITSSKHPLASAPRPHDCLSSTISTASYITTDPELQSQTDSVCGSSSFHQSSQSPEGVALDEVNAPRTPKLAPVDSSSETPSADEPGQDSFHPLIGQLAEQSSCMAEDENPAIEQLVGHPSAHSSVIEPLPGASPAGWDGTVGHWRDGLSDVPTSLWPSASYELKQSTVCGGSQEDKSSVEPGTSSGFSALESFNPLPAEVTNNQMENFEIPRPTDSLSSDSEDSIEQMRGEEFSNNGLFQKLHQPQCSPFETPDGPVSTQELVDEKGILEQSEITLESLTDSSLLSQGSGATDPGAQCLEMSTSDMTAVTMKVENVLTCTVNYFEDKKFCPPKLRHMSEMKRRTQRLYEQLEEVQHQRELRNRQETSTHNRLKAQAFHQRTLRKLRAKQMNQQ